MWRLLSLGCVLIGLAGPVQAQDTAPQTANQPVSIAVVDLDALYRVTLMGKRMAADLEDRAIALRAENDAITKALTEEEQSLTVRRPSMDVEVFRAEAAEFDTRVQGIRRTRDAAVAAFQAESDAAPRVFLERVRNIIGEMMLERGAVAVLDQRNVFLSLSTIDMTASVIARIDATVGDGRTVADD